MTVQATKLNLGPQGLTGVGSGTPTSTGSTTNVQSSNDNSVFQTSVKQTSPVGETNSVKTAADSTEGIDTAATGNTAKGDNTTIQALTDVIVKLIDAIIQLVTGKGGDEAKAAVDDAQANPADEGKAQKAEEAVGKAENADKSDKAEDNTEIKAEKAQDKSKEDDPVKKAANDIKQEAATKPAIVAQPATEQADKIADQSDKPGADKFDLLKQLIGLLAQLLGVENPIESKDEVAEETPVEGDDSAEAPPEEAIKTETPTANTPSIANENSNSGRTIVIKLPKAA